MAAKKTPATKTTTKKKAVATKTAKGAAKKAPAKKTGAKSAAAKKGSAPGKPAAKKATPTSKAGSKSATGAGSKKSATKRSASAKNGAKNAVKKAAPKKAVQKKAVQKKSAPKKAAPKSQNGSANPRDDAGVKSSDVFSERFLADQRAALLEQRATYERQSRSLRDEAASLVEDFQSGDVQFDEESGEGDTLNVAREQDLMMSSQALSAIEEIDHALAKFDLDTYGLCEVSGKPIPKARLEAIPWARERVEYKVGGLTSR